MGLIILFVFISSSLMDMQAERNHLVRSVFPRLREQLLPSLFHLEDVDLRWGVPDEAGKDNRTMRIC